jgi:lysophospholipase L1-like esterase
VIIFWVLLAALLAVAGLLFVQVLWVRSRVPRLPEAEGPRLAVCGHDPDLKLLITGESPAAGVGVAYQSDALAGQLGHFLFNQHQLANHWCVAARSGLLAAELPELLLNTPGRFQVVIIVLGVNDAKGLRSRADFRRDLERLDQVLRERHPRAMLLWCGIPPLEKFPALPRPLAWVLGWRAAQLNRELQAIAFDRDRARYLPIPVSDLGEFADDGMHPGHRGYREWGAGLARVIAEGLNNT